MTTYLGKSCSFCLPRVPFVNCRQFMYLVISLLVLRAGYGIWLYQFLIIAYLFTLNRLPIWNSQNCSMFPLAFVAGWLQGHWWGFISRNYVVWPTLWMFSLLLKDLISDFYSMGTRKGRVGYDRNDPNKIMYVWVGRYVGRLLDRWVVRWLPYLTPSLLTYLSSHRPTYLPT